MECISLPSKVQQDCVMINHLIRSALLSKQKNPRFAYIAPTFKQAKSIAWDYMKQFTAKIPHTKFNETELRVDLPNGSRITLLGSENSDGLEEYTLMAV